MKSSRALLAALPLAALAALAGCSSSSSSSSPASAPASSTAATSRAPSPPASASAVATSAPTPAASPSTAPPAGPTVYFAESGTVTGTALFEPSCGAGCLLTGDSTAALFNMTWPTWDATEAVGAGTEKIDNCTPNCASGKLEAVAVKVTFSKPVTENCAGGSTRKYWTRASFTWPNGLPADLSSGGGPTNPLVYPGIGGNGSCG